MAKKLLPRDDPDDPAFDRHYVSWPARVFNVCGQAVLYAALIIITLWLLSHPHAAFLQGMK